MLRREFTRGLERDGVVSTLRRATGKLVREARHLCGGGTDEVDPFDAQYGTDTARMVAVGALDVPDEKLKDANRYEAVRPDALSALLESLPIQASDYVFVDLGAGKGRALLVASRLPFKEIIGVEFSAALTAIAQQNIKIFKDPLQKCRRVLPLCQDAAHYSWPAEKAVVFLYNPFGESVMRSVVSNLEASLQHHPREVFVVYYQPLHRALWDAAERFELFGKADKYVIYRSRGR